MNAGERRRHSGTPVVAGNEGGTKQRVALRPSRGVHAPLMSRYVSASTGGPPSIGFPDPLKMRPSMSSETGVLSTWEQVGGIGRMRGSLGIRHCVRKLHGPRSATDAGRSAEAEPSRAEPTSVRRRPHPAGPEGTRQG